MFPQNPVFVRVCKDVALVYPIFFVVVGVCADDHSQGNIHADRCGAAGADERERYADNRCNFQHHADIHDAVDKQH